MAKDKRKKENVSRRSKTTVRKTSKKNPVRSEVKHLVVAATGALLALSIYIQGAAGFAGNFVRSFFAGLLGFGAFLLPLMITGFALYAMFSRSKRVSGLVVMQSAILVWCIMGFMHVFSVPVRGDEVTMGAYMQSMYLEGAITNGGLLGGLLGSLLRTILGNIGAYILLVIGALAMVVLLTGLSLTQGLTGLWEQIQVLIQSVNRTNYDDEEWEYDNDDDINDEFDKNEKNSKRDKSVKKDSKDKNDKNADGEKSRKNTRKRQPSYEYYEDEEDISSRKSNVIDLPVNPARLEGKVLLFHEELTERSPFPPNHEAKVVAFKNAESLDSYENFVNFTDESSYEPESSDLSDTATIKGLNRDSTRNSSKGKSTSKGQNSFTENAGEAGHEDNFDRFVENYRNSPTYADTGLDKEEAALLPATPRKQEKAGAEKATVFGTLPRYDNYQFPPLGLLTKSENVNLSESKAQYLENSRILEETLKSFKVDAKVIEVSVGPTVTRYDLAPGPGVKVTKISNLANDLALSLAAQGLRIEAPVPGKSAVGIEVPNKEPQTVLLRDILDDDVFQEFPSKLAFGMGKDIAGEPVVTDIAKMPHLLIAGATGSGKSVCINTLITSILFKAHPDEVKLLMIDPKVVELNMYNGIPHLLAPVVTDPKKASQTLQWAVAEMEKRYGKFAEVSVRDLRGFNRYAAKMVGAAAFAGAFSENVIRPMPHILIIIDELADLMMTCKGAVEESICRLAQKARAAGIHMVVATQRPSVDVITGLIKANIPSRLAFAVSSGTDSRTVLDTVGAEKLLGKGDMLFLPVGANKPVRIQGSFISDAEVGAVVEFLKEQVKAAAMFEASNIDFSKETRNETKNENRIEAKRDAKRDSRNEVRNESRYEPRYESRKEIDWEDEPEWVEEINQLSDADDDLDEFFHEAVEFLIEEGKASNSMLQRRFRIGNSRASRLMDDLENQGIVGPENGIKPRKILVTWEEYYEDDEDDE